MKVELKEIPTEKILANFYQPREKFEKEKIQELAESILSNGLINPITVKEYKGRYMIVSGERRWRAHKVANIKTISAFIKEYKDDGQFMIESLIENIHREDLTSMEKAKFIKKIWEKMGKPMSNTNKGSPDCERLSRLLAISSMVISEHLSLVDISTPQEVKEAVEKGKLAMRSASMISKLPEREQIAIAKESMKRETGMGRTEVTELIKEKIPEPIKYERTAMHVGDDILSNLHNFEHLVKELFEDVNIEDLPKSKANQIMTILGLHIQPMKELINILIKKETKPHPLIVALMKANGKL